MMRLKWLDGTRIDFAQGDVFWYGEVGGHTVELEDYGRAVGWRARAFVCAVVWDGCWGDSAQEALDELGSRLLDHQSGLTELLGDSE